MNVRWRQVQAAFACDSRLHCRRLAQIANRTVDRITRKGDGLKRFPMSGHTVPEYQDPIIRQVLEGNYRIIYRVGEEGIEILAVIHAARQMPPRDTLE